ncbi:MAG TPA: nitrilase-related carbon-nitrogen hydrolase, partial [Roseateles sp.]|nr:nitrilase-related carbon-nitrogen hydrolase [Roseateles sp.]
MEGHAAIGEPRIAIAQPAMHWTAADSAAELLSLLERAAMQGARLCVFPELALTGFHRRIAEAARPEIIAPLVQHVRTTCARWGVWASVGA